MYCSVFCPNEIYYLNGTNASSNNYFIKLENDLNEFFIKYVDLEDAMNLFVNSLDLLEIVFLNSKIDSDMTSIFGNCYNLTSIDFSNTDTSTVVAIARAFSNCKSLKTIDLSNLDLSSADDFQNMFAGCESLEYIKFPNYKESQIANQDPQFSLV